MRESCLDCTLKHLAQAIILLTESKLGHPEYKWLVIGNLAEAEAESAKDYLEITKRIRDIRHKITEDNDNIDLMTLIQEIGEIEKNG